MGAFQAKGLVLVTNETVETLEPQEPQPEKQGCQLLVEVGELLPWKGIFYRVSNVTPRTVTLVAVTTTGRIAKQDRRKKGR